MNSKEATLKIMCESQDIKTILLCVVIALIFIPIIIYPFKVFLWWFWDVNGERLAEAELKKREIYNPKTSWIWHHK